MKKFNWEEDMYEPMCYGALILIGVPIGIVFLPIILPCWAVGIMYQRYKRND